MQEHRLPSAQNIWMHAILFSKNKCYYSLRKSCLHKITVFTQQKVIQYMDLYVSACTCLNVLRYVYYPFLKRLDIDKYICLLSFGMDYVYCEVNVPEQLPLLTMLPSFQ